MRTRIQLSLFLLCFCTLLFAENKMTLAILQVESQELPAIVTSGVTEIIRSEFSNIGNFIVVERDRMDQIMEEQKLALSGMLDEDTAVEIGALLSAQKIVLGELNPLGEEYSLVLRIVDVETGQSEYSVRANASMDNIDRVTEEAARDLAQKIVSGDKEYFTALSPQSYYLRSIVPGMGQFYADRNVEGASMLTLNVLAAGAVGVTGFMTLQAKSAYNDLDAGADQSVFDSAFADWERNQDYFTYSLIALGGTYLVHWIDVLLFARPDFSSGEEDRLQISCIPAMNIEGEPMLLLSLQF